MTDYSALRNQSIDAFLSSIIKDPMLIAESIDFNSFADIVF